MNSSMKLFNDIVFEILETKNFAKQTQTKSLKQLFNQQLKKRNLITEISFDTDRACKILGKVIETAINIYIHKYHKKYKIGMFNELKSILTNIHKNEQIDLLLETPKTISFYEIKFNLDLDTGKSENVVVKQKRIINSIKKIRKNKKIESKILGIYPFNRKDIKCKKPICDDNIILFPEFFQKMLKINISEEEYNNMMGDIIEYFYKKTIEANA